MDRQISCSVDSFSDSTFIGCPHFGAAWMVDEERWLANVHPISAFHRRARCRRDSDAGVAQRVRRCIDRVPAPQVGGHLHGSLGHDQSGMRSVVRMPRGNCRTKQAARRAFHRSAAGFRGRIFRRSRQLRIGSLQVVVWRFSASGATQHG